MEGFSCAHYKRNCHKKCEKCDKFYPCRFCHDEQVLQHKFDRFQTKEMKCLFCETIQPIGKECITCSKQMGVYYCDICKLVDNDSSKSIFHCSDCGVCRLGNPSDFEHCKICGICVTKGHASMGKCRKDLVQANCPVCMEDMTFSNQLLRILPCKHVIHHVCLEQLLKHDFRCPLCLKSFVDMSDYNKMVEDYLNQHTEEFIQTDKTSTIFCHQCEKRGEANYHVMYHKCPHCGSYNTTMVESRDTSNMDVDENEINPSKNITSPKAAPLSSSAASFTSTTTPITSSALNLNQTATAATSSSSSSSSSMSNVMSFFTGGKKEKK